MNRLYLLRGCPASGKSTWIKENKLELLTISSDALRLLFPCSINENGDPVISQIYDIKVWKLLFDLVEERMRLGDPIIVDATHYKGSFIKSYEQLCQKYKYEICIVDFPISLEEAKARNNKRPVLNRVPDSVIDRMFDTLKANERDMRKKYTFINNKDVAKDILETKSKDKSNQLTLNIFEDICNNIKISANNIHKRKETINQLIEYFPEYKMMIDFDQNNKYHNMTLDNHCWEVCKHISQAFDNILFFAGLFHDIGKPLVAKKGADNYTHFYDHARIGALLFQDKIAKRLIKAGVDKKDASFIQYLIQHHDDAINDTFIEDRLKEGLNNYQINSILVLQYADAIAHVQEEKTQARAKICLDLINKLNASYKGLK